MTIRAILFDFGDTLIHTDRFDYEACLHKMHESLTQNRITVPFEDFRREYFIARDRFYKEAEETLKEQDFARRVIEALEPLGITLSSNDKLVHEAVKVFMEAFIDSLRIDDCLPQLLEGLCRKYKLGIVSNMSFAEAGFKSLRKFEIAKYFDAVVISGSFGWRKPSPRIFQEALKCLDVKPEETVFVGDSLRADVEGAKRVGMKTVLLIERDRKMPSTDTFRLYVGKEAITENPDKTITKLAELPQALDFMEKCP